MKGPKSRDTSHSPTKTMQVPVQGLTRGSTFAGRYEVMEALGKGGMGRVYRVLDEKIDEEMALKLLNPEIAADEKAIKRFKNELKFARRITHRNVCRMHDLNEEEGCFYITMEYVPGDDLKSVIKKRGALPAEKALSIAKQVCEGLTEAHRLSVVHRDLKPSNIMIDKEENARIMDFGISRSLEAKGVTEAGLIIGTPDYMSPEQVEGKEADQRSDIYSWGVMLYEMVTGRVPFEGDTALSVALKHKAEEPPDPRELNDKVSDALSAVILRCLEKEKENRFQSTGELALELKNIEEGEPVTLAVKKPQIPAFLAEEEFEEIKPVFVAREQELERLNKFLDRSLSGKGCVAFVTGEAGSGKTALVQEFARQAQEVNTGLIVASGKCNAHTGIGDPYLPFIEILGLLTGDVESKWLTGVITRDHATRLWNLLPLTTEALVDRGPDLINTFVSGTELVSRGNAFTTGRAPWLTRLKKLVEHKAALPPDLLLQQGVLFERYARVLDVLAKVHPLLLVLDDLQWADAGSIGLLFHLGKRISNSRVLIIGAFRPEEVALGRGGERHPLEQLINEFKRDFGDIELEVSKAEGRPFVEAFIDSEANQLGSEFRDNLFGQTKGHPLFTIELLRGMQDQGMLIKDKKGRWVEGTEIDWKSLPVRVDAIIEERISRLSEKLKDILTLASVEGEEFTAEVIAQLKKEEVRELIRLLSSELEKRHRLVSAKGIRRLQKQRLSLFMFQHILFQRYLYNSLNEVERAQLHQDVGTVLETLYGEQVDEIAVHLARHFEEAGIIEKAVAYYSKAGNKAIRMSANNEALAHLNKALELLNTLPETPKRDKQELTLQLALSVPLIITRGWADSELEGTYIRAKELSQKTGEMSQQIMVLSLFASFYTCRAEYQKAAELYEQCFSLVEKAEDPVLIAMSHLMVGYQMLSLGEFSRALGDFEHVIDFYDPQQHRFLAYVYAIDPGVNSRAFASWTLWHLGYPDQAHRRGQESLVLARELDHPNTMAQSLCIASYIKLLFRNFDEAKKHTKELIRLSTEKKLLYYLSWGYIFQGFIKTEEGKAEEAIALIEQGRNSMLAMGWKNLSSWSSGILAEAHGKAGKPEEGLQEIAKDLAFVESSGERFVEAELYRIKGELLLKKAEIEAKKKGKTEDEIVEQSEMCFHKAIEVARPQKAKSWELRATMSLCRLWQRQGKKEEARKILQDIYDWFTEGFDTPDLKDAKALLDELS